MRVDSSQKEDTPSFRPSVRMYVRAPRTLPPSDLFYLLHLSLSLFLCSRRASSFFLPHLRSLHLPQARKPASKSDPLERTKAGPAGLLFGCERARRSAGARARRVFNFLPFSFPTGDSISPRHLHCFMWPAFN